MTTANDSRTATDFLKHFGLDNSGAASSDIITEHVGEQVALDCIEPDPGQPRKTINVDEFEELKASMDDVGLIEPIVVRPHPLKPGHFMIIVGERRFRAATELKWPKIPAIIRHDLSDSDVLLIQMAENLVKSAMTTSETARGFARLMGDFGLGQRQMSRITGYSASTINELVGIVNGPECIASLIDTVKARPLVMLKRAYKHDPELVEDHLAQRLKDEQPISLNWAESIHALVKRDDSESESNDDTEEAHSEITSQSEGALTNESFDIDDAEAGDTSNQLDTVGTDREMTNETHDTETSADESSPQPESAESGHDAFPMADHNGFTKRSPSKASVSVRCEDGSFGRLALEYAPTEPDSLMVEGADGVIRSVKITDVTIAGYE